MTWEKKPDIDNNIMVDKMVTWIITLEKHDFLFGDPVNR